VSTCGMAAFFMQTIAVFSTFSFSWPDSLSWLFEISAIFMFDLEMLGLSCMHGTSFAGAYWSAILIPIFIILATVLGAGITKVLPVPEGWKMEFNHSFSLLGMLLTALYITLVKVVVAWFECPANPAADDTLAKRKDVVCGSDEHKAAMPAMVIGLILYVIGFYGMFMRSAWIAPDMWSNVAFREQWKFMLTRWRPDAYYWGSVLMTRNLLVAFAGVISGEPRVQLVYVIVVVTIAFALTATYQPWRAAVLNHYDVVSSVVLCYIGTFGLIFVSLEAEVTMQERFSIDSTEKTEEKDTFATVLTVLIAVFLALFGTLFVWCFKMAFPSEVEKQAQANMASCGALMDKLKTAVENPDFLANASRLIAESTQYDRSGLENFIVKINADSKTAAGFKATGATDTISINKAKQQAGVANTVSA